MSLGTYIQFPATSAGGSSANVNLIQVGGSSISLGQKTMANSIPVVIASDQSALPISVTPSGTQDVNLIKVGGTSLTLGQTTMSASIPVVLPSDQSAIPVSQSGTWTTGRTWSLSSGSDSVDTELASAILADDSVVGPTTAPTYSFLMGYGSGGGDQWARLRIAADNTDGISSSSTGHLQVLSHPVGFNGTTWDRQRSAGTNSDALATTSVGSLYVNSFNMLFNGTSWDRFRGDTTNGLDVDVTRVSGTVTVSGTVSATQSGTWTVQPGNTANTTAWLVTGTGGTFPATQSGTWNINNISGTISLPTGAATESSLAKIPLTQGSTTSGQSGALVQGAVTTSAPTYTTGTTNPLSLTTAGALRVDASASTQPVSGTVTANQGGAPWSVNQTQWNGVAVSTGNGVAGTGVVRVAVASDNTAFSVNAVQSGTWNIGTVTTITNAVTVSQSTAANLNATVTGSGTAGTPASGVVTVQGFNPTNADSTALEASRVIKASAGKLYTLMVFNSSTSAQYVLIFNSTTVPADGTAPTIMPIYVPPNSNASLDYGINGRSFSTGIAVCNSSTSSTKTIGSANCWFSATYI